MAWPTMADCFVPAGKRRFGKVNATQGSCRANRKASASV
jgi:hypothetical protein